MVHHGQEVIQISIELQQRSPAWVIGRAREVFLAGGRVEVGDLAAEAGVNRATVFRWVGGRDRLLGEVVWSIAAPTMDALAAEPVGSGGERVAHLVADFAETAICAPHFWGFVSREPHCALRVMTTPVGGVQNRIADRLAEVVVEEVESGALAPSLPVPDLAFLLVRLAETFVYSDMITGGEPDVDKVRVACAALLGVPDPGDLPGRARAYQRKERR